MGRRIGALPKSLVYQMVLFWNIAATDLRKNGLSPHVENPNGERLSSDQ
jgi:hypothetical protein